MSVCPQNFCTLKLGNGKRNCKRFPIARGVTKLKPKEIFNDFTISQDPINSYKLKYNTIPDCRRSYKDLRSWSRQKVNFAICCCLNKKIKLIFLGFKNVSKEPTLSNFEAEVGAESNFAEFIL